MGEVFAGRYELLDPVAVGGMGTVWRIHDRADGEVKAAKILRQSDAATLLRFVREQSMRIDHPHVVTPQSWAGMDDRVLFTMPLVRGGSVATLMSEYGALPLRWIGTLLDQALQALEAVHAAGIVHRDIKPANLLLEPTRRGVPHLRLTDFGIAVPLDEPRMTHASMVIGSPGYMAPEQWRGADPDPRQDLYALGLVGLEMLTGQRPPADAGHRTLPEPTGDPARDGLVKVLGRATQEETTARPASASELRQELAALRLTAIPAAPDEQVSVRDHFEDGPVADLSTQPFSMPTVSSSSATVPPTVSPTAATTVTPTDDDAATAAVDASWPHRGGSPSGTRPETAARPVPATAQRKSALPGLLLIVLGIACLVAAVLVLLSI